MSVRLKVLWSKGFHTTNVFGEEKWSRLPQEPDHRFRYLNGINRRDPASLKQNENVRCIAESVFVRLLGLDRGKGATAVIASLWEVSDISTSRLMLDFYRNRASRPANTKAEALRQAQVDLIHDSDARYAHPFYWAPFVLIGNWQ
jgi:CHAT domain